jgi:hypothetical protein
MDNVRRIGIRAIPDDVNIATFLSKMIEEHDHKREAVEEQLADTLEETIRASQPPVFAFAKLMNYLATLEKPELIELLSSSLWRTAWQ